MPNTDLRKTLAKIAEALQTTVPKLFSENQAEAEKFDILQIKTNLGKDILNKIVQAFHQISEQKSEL